MCKARRGQDPRTFYSEEFSTLFTPTVGISNKIIHEAQVEKLKMIDDILEQET
jgi:hypothetical protein